MLLLPGLDGTGRLFTRLLPWLQHAFEVRVVSYPLDRKLDWEELVAYVRARIPSMSRYAIVAESFSGPIAIRLAATAPPGLTALVLVATFASAGFGCWLRLCLTLGAKVPLPWALVSGVAMHWLSGAEPSLGREVHAAIRCVHPRVVRGRLRMLLDLDVREELARCRVPILCLTGDADRLVSLRQTRELEESCRQLTTRSLPTPHLVLQTEPRLAAQLIEEFLAR